MRTTLFRTTGPSRCRAMKLRAKSPAMGRGPNDWTTMSISRAGVGGQAAAATKDAPGSRPRPRPSGGAAAGGMSAGGTH